MRATLHAAGRAVAPYRPSPPQGQPGCNMSSLFDALFAEVATPQFSRVFGTTATIARGAFTATDVTVQFVDRAYQELNQDDIVTTLHGTAFIIAAADYELNGAAVLPRVGDRITVGTDVYEVVAGPAGRPSEREDPEGTELRVFAQQVTSG